MIAVDVHAIAVGSVGQGEVGELSANDKGGLTGGRCVANRHQRSSGEPWVGEAAVTGRTSPAPCSNEKRSGEVVDSCSACDEGEAVPGDWTSSRPPQSARLTDSGQCLKKQDAEDLSRTFLDSVEDKRL